MSSELVYRALSFVKEAPAASYGVNVGGSLRADFPGGLSRSIWCVVPSDIFEPIEAHDSVAASQYYRDCVLVIPDSSKGLWCFTCSGDWHK